jgi:hypothetical protein
VENAVQAVARDLLVTQVQEIEKAPGLRMRFSVHDEIVVASGRCRCQRVDPLPGVPVEATHAGDCLWVRGRQQVRAVMSSVPVTLPGLVGLPVGCELSRAVLDRYAK